MMEELGAGSFVTPTVRLVSQLAQGGMGTVWVAEHLVLETKVVVKLMTKELAANVDGAARFAREAAIAAAVKSPHVVQVFDSGVTEDGVAYIVMELLEGHDLGAHLTASGRMAPGEVAIIITQLAKALARAHRVHVVHRDLKPENVFLCDVEGGEAFVKLLDFGTAKDEGRAPFTTTAGQLLGTPYYMSPEQILGEEVDTRADIWALGVLAFEALTGVRPFDGVTVGAITLAIHTTKPRPSDVVPDLPPALDEWFARACARDPAERFQTVRAAGDAFARALAGDASIADSSPDFIVESVPGVPPSSPALTNPKRLVTGPHRPAMSTPSERVATSLSSTLSSPRHERRRLQWIAGGVVTAAVVGMLALFTYDSPSATSPANAASSSAGAVATAVTASTASAATPPAPATASAVARSSATTMTAMPATVTATPAAASTTRGATTKIPATLPVTPPPASAASASASASVPASASASASASAPAPAPAPASSSAPAPTPPADPVPTAPIDLHDLLPPASPPP
jgi:serine/threonine protein kinase